MVHDTFTELLLSVEEGRSQESVENKSVQPIFEDYYGWKSRIESPELLEWLGKIRPALIAGTPRKDLPKIPRTQGKRDSFTEAWIQAEESGADLPEPPEPKKNKERPQWDLWNSWLAGNGMEAYNEDQKRKKTPSTKESSPVITITGKEVTPKEFESKGGDLKRTVTVREQVGTDTRDVQYDMKSDDIAINPFAIYEPEEKQKNPLVLRPKVQFDDSPHCRWDILYDTLGKTYSDIVRRKMENLRTTDGKYREMVKPSPYSKDYTEAFEEWYCRISNLKIADKWDDGKGNQNPVVGLVNPDIEVQGLSPIPKLEKVPGIRIPKPRAATIFINLIQGNPLNFAGKPGTGKTQMARRIAAVRGGCMVFVPPLGEEAEGDLLGKWNTARQIVGIEQAKIAAERIRLIDAELDTKPDDKRRQFLEDQRAIMEQQINLGSDPYHLTNWEKGGIEKALIGRYNPVRKRDQGCLCVVDEVNRYGYTTQNRLLHVTDQKEIVRPITHERVGAEGDFNMIVTTNEDDLGVKEMSGALMRRFQTVIFSTPSIEEEIQIVGLAVDKADKPKCKPTAEVLVRSADAMRKKFEQKGPTTSEVIRAYKALSGGNKAGQTKLFEWETQGVEQCFVLYNTEEVKETIASFLVKESDQMKQALEIVGDYLSTHGQREPTGTATSRSTIGRGI